MPRPLLFCNIGWMKEYRGQTAADKIVGGGRYVQIQKRGEEVCNFLNSNGTVYGYVQPVGRHINLKKLGATPKAASVDGVDVVVTARRPRGSTVIVGWFSNATVYREPQAIARPTATHRANGIKHYRYAAAVSDVKLLPPEQRTFIVPRGKGGMGQSNVWYADRMSDNWLARVRDLLAGNRRGPKRGTVQSPPNNFKKKQVEDAAMRHVWKHFSELGYTVKDVSKENLGWDLEATSGALTLRVEVKGLSGNATVIELTPNEYEAFVERSVDYRLCIVTDCLSKPLLTTCAFNPVDERWSAQSQEKLYALRVKEKIAASISVT